MPNYNYAGVTMAPPPGWANGAMDKYNTWATEFGSAIGNGVTDYSNDNLNNRLTPSQYQEMAKRYGWNTMTGSPSGGASPVGTGVQPNQWNTAWNAARNPTTATPSGVQVPYSNEIINPNDPNQRYRAAMTPKYTDLMSQESGVAAAIKAGTDALKPFSAHLADAASRVESTFQGSKAASDPSQAIAALRAGQSRYMGTTDQGVQDYQALNAETAAANQKTLDERRANLDLVDQYARENYNNMAGGVTNYGSRYALKSGTPQSFGSALGGVLAKGYADAGLAASRMKLDARDALLNNEMQVTSDNANREQTRIGQFNPAMALQQLTTGQGTEQTVYQLQQAATAAGFRNATEYVQALAAQGQIPQNMLSTIISQLGALGTVKGHDAYYGLQDKLGVIPSQPQYYNQNTGSYPNQGRYSPAQGPQGGGRYSNQGGGYQNQLTAGNAPTQVNPRAPAGASGDWVWDSTNQRWQNWKTGATSATDPTAPNRYGGAPAGYNQAAPDSHYDELMGAFVNNTTGVVTQTPQMTWN